MAAAASLLLVAGLSCSAGESTRPEPAAPVPLLVSNGTCALGQCDSLRILGFPVNQPNTPGGLWSLDLGVVTTTHACLTIPESRVFRVIGVHDDGTRDTVAYTWTPALGIALSARPPSSYRIFASPSTATFVPAEAAGWSVTVPGDTTVVPAPPCTAVAAHLVSGRGQL